MTTIVRTPIRLTIPADQWEPIGFFGGADEDPRIRLFGPPLNINGAFMHVTAIEVTEKDGVQVAAHPALEETFNEMQAIYEGEYETLTIAGRQYALLIYPYSN